MRCARAGGGEREPLIDVAVLEAVAGLAQLTHLQLSCLTPESIELERLQRARRLAGDAGLTTRTGGRLETGLEEGWRGVAKE